MKAAKKTCSSCVFFAKEVLPGEKKLHKDTGHKPYGKPCMSYEVDPFPLMGSNRKLNALAAIADVANGIKPSEAQNLAHVLLAVPLLQRVGLRFMQKVVYRWRGFARHDYLNNWLVAHVLTINPELDQLRLVSYNGEFGISAPRSSIVPMEEFEAHRKRLIKANRIWDPEYPQHDVPTAPSNIDALAARLRTLDSVLSNADDAKLLLPKTGKLRLGEKVAKPKAKSGRGKGRSGLDMADSFRVR